MKKKEGIKFDGEKIRMDLVPVAPTVESAKVWTFGAVKYGDRNWELGMKWSKPYGALLRHVMMGFWQCEDLDPESGILHLAHARCCIDMLIEYQLKNIGTDDRPKKDNK